LTIVGAAFLISALSAPSRADQVAEQAQSLFAEGCPRPGLALAQKITDPRLKMRGPDALGGPGDYLLMNDRAAFIISGLERINTYYYYGGIPIDAVALDGCTQLNPEQFEELGFFVGRMNKRDPLDVNLRAFKGERIEILNDGADGGPAVIRAHGSDEVFWIVEFTLIRTVYGGLGRYKPRSRPFGLDIYIDYILHPYSATLVI